MNDSKNKADAASAREEKPSGAYIDELNNDESDLRDIRLAQERVISPKDRRILAVLAGLNIVVFALIGLYLIMTGSADEYDSIKGESAFNMKTPFYNSATVLTGELEPVLSETTYPYGMQEKFRPLFSVNDDTVGWLRFDGTPVDYVVV